MYQYFGVPDQTFLDYMIQQPSSLRKLEQVLINAIKTGDGKQSTGPILLKAMGLP